MTNTKHSKAEDKDKANKKKQRMKNQTSSQE